MLPFFPQVTPTPTDHSKQITEAAAADLQSAFTEIAALFEAEAGVKVNLVLGSTAQLTLLLSVLAFGVLYLSLLINRRVLGGR